MIVPVRGLAGGSELGSITGEGRVLAEFAESPTSMLIGRGWRELEVSKDGSAEGARARGRLC